MIKDEVCIIIYCNVMYYNKYLFWDKVVFDVGCGIGILFMFVVKVGVKYVYVVSDFFCL